MSSLTDRNIVAIQNVMQELRDRATNIEKYRKIEIEKLKEIEKTKGKESYEYILQQTEIDKLTPENISDMEKIVERMKSVLTTQQSALSQQVNIARNILNVRK